MAVRKNEWTSNSTDSIPKRARFGFRISKSDRPFDLPWCVETWGKIPHVYMKTESQHLVNAIKMMVIARTHKSKET